MFCKNYIRFKSLFFQEWSAYCSDLIAFILEALSIMLSLREQALYGKNMKKFELSIISLSVCVALCSLPAMANPIFSGFNGSTLAANDDGSTGAVGLGFTFNFYGTNYTQTFVNNNGNITFGNPLSTFTPTAINGATSRPIIAPFFADVDTRGIGSGLVSYGAGAYNGHTAFGVNYPNVGYFPTSTNLLNNFQLVLVDRSDLATGDADIYFNYGSIQFETGSASGGSGGLGGTSARAGYSNGTGAPGSFFELAGSGIHGGFLNGGPFALNVGTNDGTPGQFLFTVRGGTVVPPVEPPNGNVPEPATLGVMALGLAAIGALRRKKN